MIYANPFCRERRELHRLMARDPGTAVGPGDVTFADGWAVACDWPDAEFAACVQDYLGDFLGRWAYGLAR